MTKINQKIEKIGTSLLVVGVLSLVITAYFVVVLGGEAMMGMSKGGQYYLGDKGHFTHVSKDIYTFSLWNAWLQMVTWPLGMVFLAPSVIRRYIDKHKLLTINSDRDKS